jgi:hypothetical protein
MESFIEQIRAVEAALKAKQQEVGRGPGGQEISLALTQLRLARLILADQPTTTPFTQQR